jgi:hypothetical protein
LINAISVAPVFVVDEGLLLHPFLCCVFHPINTDVDLQLVVVCIRFKDSGVFVVNDPLRERSMISEKINSVVAVRNAALG